MPFTGHFKYSEETLIKSASEFIHRSDWKKAEKLHYDAAWRRGLLDKCCAHMTPKAHPYSGSYVIYAYEFTDRCAYVGLTFTPSIRRTMHLQRGPVFNHLKQCPTFTYKVLEENLASPKEAMERERYWIDHYQRCWTLLNVSSGGGLGTVQLTKWTKESVMAEARKFSTKQAWIEGSQFSYRLAKREGWFAEASAHMPKRVLGIGVGKKFTAEHRRKISEAKTGTKQSKAHRSARSASLKSWWTSKRQSVVKA